MNEQIIEIREVTVDEVIDNFELLKAHWSEVALNKEVMVLKPDVARYKQLDELGMLFGIGAFDNDHLVGYSASFIMPHPHYSDLVVASNDVLFVHSDYRKGRLGLRLIQETERIAKDRGAELVTWHAKQSTALEQLMPRLGYGVQDIIFSKVI